MLTRSSEKIFNPFMPTVAFNICCPRDCVSLHNGGIPGAPLKPLRDDSALRALSSLRGLVSRTDVSLSDSKCWNGGQKLVAKTQRWAKMGFKQTNVKQIIQNAHYV